MTPKQRKQLIETIVAREKLRPMQKLARLFADPLHAIPYYILALLSHIRPYRVTFPTLWGTTMTGYLPESNTFYYYGFCEANLTSFLLRFLKKGQTFIDVGAHIGFYSILSSPLVGKQGCVYSFEPTRWTYDLLKKNTRNLTNIETINAGVADKKDTVSFADYGPGYGAYNSASADGTILTFKPSYTTTQTTTLDQFCKERHIHPDFIKIDAEGFEHKILLGMDSLLANERPLITLEMANDEIWSKNCKASSEMLNVCGYVPYEMTSDGYVKECILQPTYRYTNILFVPKEKTALIAQLLQT